MSGGADVHKKRNRSLARAEEAQASISASRIASDAFSTSQMQQQRYDSSTRTDAWQIKGKI